MFTTAASIAQSRRRRIFIRWTCVVLVVFGGAGGYIAYIPWRLESLNRAARAALDAHDYSEASLKARRALQVDPNAVDACRIMAEIGEHDHSSDAVIWRERVLHLGGETTESLIAYAAAALSFGKHGVAKSALDRVSEADRQAEPYLAVAGTLASATGDDAKAARCYAEASRINPGNAAYRLALGRAQTKSSDYTTRDAGRRVLGELAADPEFGNQALRTLVLNYESLDEFQAALRECHKLVTQPGHAFADELLRLRLQKATADEGFAASLAVVEKAAERDIASAGSLLVWMSHAGLASEGLDWALKRAPKVGEAPEARPALAGCYLTLRDWPSLLTATQTGLWKPVEYVRHAYRSKAMREQGDRAFARTEWEVATSSAARLPDALAWLARMAAEWQWPNEAEESLWAVLDQTPGATWAIDALTKQYSESDSTAGLRRIAAHLVKFDPTNEDAQNNLAVTSLLLGKEVDRSAKIARDLYDKHRDNAAYASTYALALYFQDQPAEALKVLDALPEALLERPAIAAYYVIILGANKIQNKSGKYMGLARSATLLQEERNLLTRAEQLLTSEHP